MTTPAEISAPGSVQADGALRVVFVPTLADPSAPTLAELNAASAVDLSCYLTPTGFASTTEEASIDDSRLCSRETYETPGRESNGLELTYVYDPQNTVPAENEAYTTLKRGTQGFVVPRWGRAFEEPFAAGDIVDVMPITGGAQRKQTPEANSTLKVAQKMFIRSGVRRDVAVVA